MTTDLAMSLALATVPCPNHNVSERHGGDPMDEASGQYCGTCSGTGRVPWLKGVRMKALTLTQPWAQLVATGKKQIETRSWSTRYRGPLYIHAGKGFPRDAQNMAITVYGNSPILRYLPFGKIIARVYLLDVRTTEYMLPRLTSSLERKYGDYSPGRYAWILTNIEQLEPIPCKGARGLWNIPDDLLGMLKQ